MMNSEIDPRIGSLKTAVQLVEGRRREPRAKILYDDPARIYCNSGVLRLPEAPRGANASSESRRPSVFTQDGQASIEAEIVDLSANGCSLLFRDRQALLDEYSLCLIDLPRQMNADNPARVALLRWRLQVDSDDPALVNAGFEFL